VLPGCGHWVGQERPDAVNDEILRFLAHLDSSQDVETTRD
jgi:pimeloyl-ACP methyl ester carboxylesterase